MTPDIHGDRPDAQTFSEWAWMVGLLLLALAVRLTDLGSSSFWADEVFTLRDVALFPDSIPINPIPYAAIALFVRWLGESEWSARLAPAILGALSVPLLQWIGRQMFDRWTGRIAALFAALSPWHLFWSQNARHYAFTFFFAALAGCALFLAFEGKARLRWGLVALLSALCLAFSHAPASTLIVGLAGYVVLRWLLRGRDPLPSGTLRVIALVFGPFIVGAVLIFVMPGVRGELVDGWGHPSWSRSPVYVLLTFLHGVTLPVVMMAMWGVCRAEPEESDRGRRARVFLWCATGAPLACIVLLSVVQNVAGYYLFFVTPFVFLLAAQVCARFFRTHGALRWVPVTVVASALLAGTGLYFVAENGGRPDWRGALQALDALATDGDRVLLSLPEIGRYYLPGRELRIEKLGTDGILEPARLLEQGAHGRTYVVVDEKTLAALDPAGAFRRWLDAHGRRVIRAPGYARAADRTIEVFRLDYPTQSYSRNTESP